MLCTELLFRQGGTHVNPVLGAELLSRLCSAQVSLVLGTQLLSRMCSAQGSPVLHTSLPTVALTAAKCALYGSANKVATHAFFQAPYEARMHIEAVYELTNVIVNES